MDLDHGPGSSDAHREQLSDARSEQLGDARPERLGDARAEQLGDARDGGVGERVSLWLLAHRRRLRRLGALGAGALVVLAGVGAGVVYLRGPHLPQLVRARSTVTDAELTPVHWSRSAGGRPSSGPVTAVRADVVLRGLESGPGARTELLGLTGPGLVHRDQPSVVSGAVGAAAPVAKDGAVIPLAGEAELDCDRARLPVRPQDYRLRVRVHGYGRTVTGSLPAGELGTWFAGRMSAACGAWLARRDVEITAVAIAADPHRPRAELTLTVANQGAQQVRLWPRAGDASRAVLHAPGTDQPVGTVTIAAGTTAPLRATLEMVDCTPVVSPSPEVSRLPTTSRQALDLVALSGPDGEPPAPGATAPGDGGDGTDSAEDNPFQIDNGDDTGGGPVGLRLDAGVARRLADLNTLLCGGMQALPDLWADGEGVRRDADGRAQSVPLHVTTTDPRHPLLGAAFDHVAEPEVGVSVLTPRGSRFTAAGDGTLLLRLALRVGPVACPSDGGSANMPALALTLVTADRAGSRTVPFVFRSSMDQRVARFDALCR